MKNEMDFESASLHAVQDQQGKIYFAKKTAFGWLTVEKFALPAYGHTDLGLVYRAFNRLAQYEHASRILQTRLVNDFNNYVSLVREIDR